MYELVLYSLAFLVLTVASYTDIKTREVPDWVNYGLIFTAISLRGIFALRLSQPMIFIDGLLGFGIMLAIACLMFYTGQWGGGDSKLLMGLGAIFGLGYDIPSMMLALFLVNLVLAGAVYGLAWSAVLFVQNWRNTSREFLKLYSQRTSKLMRVPLYLLSAFFFGIAYFVYELRTASLALAIMLPFSFYLWACTKAVENVAMLKRISPLALTEGDWIAEEIVLGGKRICGPSDLGVSKKQIAVLTANYRNGRVKDILIKEGIPFVPSFLVAFLATIFFGNWIFLLI